MASKLWPRTAPALQVFPTLQKIAPGLRPRQVPFVRPGNLQQNITVANRCKTACSSLYHDLGVCIYAGLPEDQLQKVTKILQNVTALDRSQADLGTVPPYRNDNRKMFKYRLKTEDSHMDQNYKTQEGLLSIQGVLELGTQALTQWSKTFIESIQKNQPELNVKHVDQYHADVHRVTRYGGLYNQTTNGPRRLNVDAHCVVRPKDDTFVFEVRLYTIGSGNYVGTMRTQLQLVAGDDLTPLSGDQLTSVSELIEHNPGNNYYKIMETTTDLWKIEGQVWAERVDKKMYPNVPQPQSRRYIQSKPQTSGDQ